MPYYSKMKLPALHTRSFMLVVCNQKFQYFGLKWWQFPLSGLTVVQNRFEPELDLMEPVLLRTVVQVRVQQHRTLSVRSRFRFTGKVPKLELNQTPATLGGGLEMFSNWDDLTCVWTGFSRRIHI